MPAKVFISELVLGEIEATPDSKLRAQLTDSIKGFSVLLVSTEAERLAQEYLKYLHIPELDTLHMTWNMEHLARERTRRIVDNINFLQGAPGSI
jgi:hypothetical protein